MDAYIYAADLYCDECGVQIRDRINREGNAPADGGGEADQPCHCGAGPDCLNAIELRDGRKVGAFLENPLTSDGEDYVRQQARDNPESEVVQLWLERYDWIRPEYRGDVTASFKLGDREYRDVPVINPGAWWGKAWLITIQMGYDASLFIVEADSASDAIDEFSDSEFGHLIHVAPEDMGDYDAESAHYDGSGRMIDLDNLGIEGQEGFRDGKPIDVPFPCRYHADGLPTAGIDPRKLDLYCSVDA